MTRKKKGVILLERLKKRKKRRRERGAASVFEANVPPTPLRPGGKGKSAAADHTKQDPFGVLGSKRLSRERGGKGKKGEI